MLQAIADNAGTIIVSLVLIGVVALIVLRLHRDKRRGKSSCGGNCGCCLMAGSCHKPS